MTHCRLAIGDRGFAAQGANPGIENRKSEIENLGAAVFLDRDGTIIEEVAYLNDPTRVSLLAGVTEFIRGVSAAGYRVVLVSNQSGVARGLISEERLREVHGHLEVLLAAEGAHLDAAYYCPYLDGPEAVVNKYRKDSDWRKPRPGMLLQAAKELSLDLARSWMVGDSPSDMEAGRRAGCRTILLQRDGGVERSTLTATHVLCTWAQAAAIVLGDPQAVMLSAAKHLDGGDSSSRCCGTQNDSVPARRDSE